MNGFAQKRRPPQQRGSLSSNKTRIAAPRGTHAPHPTDQLQRTVGNRAVQQLLGPKIGQGRAPHDKSVNGNSDSISGLVQDQSPGGAAGAKGGAAPAPAAPAPAAPKKTAGVDSFAVKWKKNTASGPKTAQLRLDYSAKFTKDATHDPALAQFRQNAFHMLEVTAGPHKGLKDDNSPLHDDNYSRTDDDAGGALADVTFTSNDNPGTTTDALDKEDVINYSFTAEQMIVDTSGGKETVIKKHGPHTATITGKHPRVWAGVPKTFS